MTGVVLAVGQQDRGDDAVGLVLATRLLAELADLSRAAGVPPTQVRTLSSPVRLIEAWEGFDPVVVVDALRSGQPPGEVTVVAVSGSRLPARPGAGGTHGFGVAEAVELARVLGRLPHRLTLVGVEAAGFVVGAPLSPRVRAALPEAEAAVLRALRASPPD